MACVRIKVEQSVVSMSGGLAQMNTGDAGDMLSEREKQPEGMFVRRQGFNV